MADGDEPLQGHGQRQVYGNGLGDQRQGVNDRREKRIDFVEINEEKRRPGIIIYGRYTEQQDGSDDKDGIASRQPDQKIVDGGAHLRPRQDDHGNDITHYTRETDEVQKDAVGDELE